MQVQNFIIHAISKAQGANVATVQEGKSPLAIDDKVSRFVDTAFNLFDRQSKGLLFAGFDAGGAKEVFQNYLSAYHTQKKLGYLEFTTKCAHHLADTMKPVNFATGGFLIFAEAEMQKQRRLCILLLSQELKFAVDEKDLTLLDVPALNLERMGVGCSISLTDWLANLTEPVAYVRGSRAVSEYFMRFVGAKPNKTPKEASRGLAAYTENFLVGKKIDADERIERMRRLHDYCAKQVKANEPVDLMVIGSIIYQEDKDGFCQDANANGISSEFHVDTKYLKNLLQIEYRTKGVTLRLTRSAIRDNVEVDLKKHKLTLKNVDENTLAEIEEALGDG